MAQQRYPIPKRFNVALSETAYARLRKLNEQYHFGNNYLLTILLENLDEVVDQNALDKVMNDFAAEYGAPSAKKRKYPPLVKKAES